MSEQFSAEEFAEAVAAALLGLDDDHPPPSVVVQLPSGTRRPVVSVRYEPATNELILDTYERPNPLFHTRWNPANPTWVEDMLRVYQPQRGGRHALFDATEEEQ